jgi:large subunit ribosomal protein L3
MTRVFLENGDAEACTLVEAGPCTVVTRKTKSKHGYDAIQLGFEPLREKLVKNPMKGHFKKAGTDAFRYLREVRLEAEAKDVPEPGAKVTCDVFAEGDYVDVIGTMKGRGRQGVVRRHGFSTMKESHGVHYFWRHAGSIGCRKPQHTVKGTRMGGHMGNSRVTVQSLEILRVDLEKNLLYVKGAIPGPNKRLVLLRESTKRRAAAKA